MEVFYVHFYEGEGFLHSFFCFIPGRAGRVLGEEEYLSYIHTVEEERKKGIRKGKYVIVA